MPKFVVDKASRILNKSKLPLNSSKVLIIGVAYKDNISDYRQSPVLCIIEILNKNSAYVKFFDPFVKEYKYKGLNALDKKLIKSKDIIILTTSHTEGVDYKMIKDNATHKKGFFIALILPPLEVFVLDNM